MKLVKRVVKTAQRIQRRRKASAERGNIAHTFASFFDALACTPPGPEGAQAYSGASRELMKLFDVDPLLSIEDVIGEKPYALVLSDVATGEFWQRFKDLLEECVALDLGFPGLQPGDASSDAVDVTEILFSKGFEPILRCPENEHRTFRILFTRREKIDPELPQLRKLVERACNPSGTIDAVRNQDIPVFIPCFNNQTYCRTMVTQLLAGGFTDITLIDNASPSPDMHRFLDEVEDVVKVERLKDNLGPKRSVFTQERYESMPRYFCVTDPDIVFNAFLPDDFIAQLIDQTKIHDVCKAGFALDIMHRQFFNDTTVHLLHQKWKIWEWEERFWTNPAGKTRDNDPIFRADIDTTFALYDKERWSWDTFFNGVRVAGRFTALHTPWYAQSDVPMDEREAYRRESAYSYYKM